MNIKGQQFSTKQIVFFVVSILALLIVIIFFLTGLNNSDNEEKKSPIAEQLGDKPLSQINSERQPSTTRFDPQANGQIGNTGPMGVFDAETQKYFYSLEKTGPIDTLYYSSYTSPRYEAILGGDHSSGIPISELNNPINSDLDILTFNKARDTAIEISKASITGQGATKWAKYLDDEQPGICVNFHAPYAGASTLPIPGKPGWIISYVRYEAYCPTPGGTEKISQLINIYFDNSNGAMTPIRYYDLPSN